jgi:hypothetical protein
MSVPRAKLKAQQKWREGMKKDGFRQVTVWVPGEYVEKLKAFSEHLREGTKPRVASTLVFRAPGPKRVKGIQ